MTKLFSYLFFILSVSVFAQTPLPSNEAEKFKSEIAQKDYKTLVGEFTQKKKLEFMAEEETSSGEFYFLAPDKLNWTYLQPIQYSMIFNGDKLYVYNEGEKTQFNVSDNPLFGKLRDLIAGSINGKMLESPGFESKYFKNENYFIAKLVPTDPAFADVLSEVLLYFEPSNYTVHHLKMTTPSGDLLRIEFKNLKTDVPIGQSVFGID